MDNSLHLPLGAAYTSEGAITFQKRMSTKLEEEIFLELITIKQKLEAAQAEIAKLKAADQG